MNYKVKGFRIIHINEDTSLEEYERDVSNYNEAQKEETRLKSLGYVNIVISKVKERAHC
jgi:hypothetical protein